MNLTLEVARTFSEQLLPQQMTVVFVPEKSVKKIEHGWSARSADPLITADMRYQVSGIDLFKDQAYHGGISSKDKAEKRWK